LQDLARRNDVQIAKWYGFVDASGREREWLTGTAADVSRPTGIYSAELTATPDKLLKLMEDKRVILLMPRT
jgi:hypothetical protein